MTNNITKKLIKFACRFTLLIGALVGVMTTPITGIMAAGIAWVVFMGIPTYVASYVQNNAKKENNDVVTNPIVEILRAA